MLKYGISNVRRLEHVDPIEIKRITLLLGRNSGGKSTFLRTFPLFRQSLMTRTSSPILWYGDLVDFGSFETVLSRHIKSNNIKFSYNIDELNTDDRAIYLGDHLGYYGRLPPQLLKNVTYEVTIERKAERTRISSVSINASEPDLRVLLELDEGATVSRIVLNDEDVTPSIAPLRMTITAGTLFPDVRYVRPKEDVRRDYYTPGYDAVLMPALTKLLRRTIDQRTRDKSINQLAAKLLSQGFANRQRFLAAGNAHGVTVGKLFQTLAQEDNRTFKQLSMLLNAAALPTLFRAIGGHLKSILSTTLYIGPARARSERYYRYQDLAVSEIDPDGKNFPMFLNSLSKVQIEAFSSWVKNLFGYGVSVSRQTGHISINLTDAGFETNIVDVGYGVSQILPVLGQVWWARQRSATRDNRSPLALLTIEQPELHLHPAHQALLADALVGEATADPVGSRPTPRMHYVVETHSETLVNRLGEFIAAGRLAASDVQVVLFEPEDTGKTSVRTVEFNEKGALIDWPYGFFQPSVF